MKIYRHPAATSYSTNWAIWSKGLIPTSLVADLTEPSKPYFTTKDTGSGIEVEGEWSTWSSAESSYITMCNASSADDYLGGSGRPLVIALNVITHRITDGIITAR